MTEAIAVREALATREVQEVLFPEPLVAADVPATAQGVLDTLAQVRRDLAALRARREEINRVIKLRVAHEAALEQMARIAKKVLEEVNDEDGDGAPPAPVNE